MCFWSVQNKQSLILSAPDDHMLRGLAAAYAYVRDLFLFKGDATGLYSARVLLYLVLALAVAAPHSADKAGLGGSDLKKLLICCSIWNSFIYEKTNRV